MQTVLLAASQETVSRAVVLLQENEVVALPTETVYGLAANAFSDVAVRKIYKAKNRPDDNPLIVHVLDLQMAQQVCSLSALSLAQREMLSTLVDLFCPGPLTFVLPKTDLLSETVTGKQETVCVRIPAHSVCREIIQKSNLPLAAPSANLSGRPSGTTAADVLSDMAGRIPLVVDGGCCAHGVESTILSLVARPPLLLRKGGITKEQIEDAIGEIDVCPETAKMHCPGLNHRHYAPNKPLLLIDTEKLQEKTEDQIIDKIAQTQKRHTSIGLFCTDDIYALVRCKEAVVFFSAGDTREHKTQIGQRLFSALRELECSDVSVIVAVGVGKEGLGAAIMDRLQRASTETI